MQLQFLGANRQVTGSCYCLRVGGKNVVVDCGMFQEREYLERNWAQCPIAPRQIDLLVLTHAHVDHVGLLPRLASAGFRGPVYCTPATADLAELILRDAAKIQEEDAAYKRRRHEREHRKGRHPEVPLYTDADVDRVIPLLRPLPYGKPHALTPEVQVTFFDAGHILGSAILEFQVRENGAERTIVFSGDIGQWNKPIIRDPTLLSAADFVVMESTYGDRDHQDHGDIATQLADVVNDTLRRGGNVVIPTFAVERAQELMYYLRQLVHDRRIGDVAIYLDSPMAVDAVEIYRRHQDSFDAESWELIAGGRSPLNVPGMRLARTTDESKAIGRLKGGAVIMATSGMCTAGRIKHHLRANLPRSESTVLFVGYQAHGTLGRQILDGNREVRIHGQMWPVRARIAQIYGFSGHADRSGLLRWLGAFKTPLTQVYLTHGEESAALALQDRIQKEMGHPVTVPHYRQVVEL